MDIDSGNVLKNTLIKRSFSTQRLVTEEKFVVFEAGLYVTLDLRQDFVRIYQVLLQA